MAERALYEELAAALRAQRPVVYCQLVATYGSTPQKAGAAMLVFPDGAQSGTIGGGCVEAEVRRAALQAGAEGQPRVLSLSLDGDYAWEDGLICGGRVCVLLLPIERGSPAAEYAARLCTMQQQEGGTEVVVVDRQLSGLPEAACFLCDANNELARSLPQTAELPAIVRQHVQALEQPPRAHVAAGLAFLPCVPRCRLLIVGGGHIGKAVTDLASQLDFEVCVVDDREEFVTADRFPHAVERLAGDLDTLLPALEITPQTYCVIVTRGHVHDARALFLLVDRPARYVGMIGSRRKIRVVFDELLAAGVSAQSLERVYAPLGIDIGSRTVPEIAVSVCAELVAHRNLGGRVPGRPPSVRVLPE